MIWPRILTILVLAYLAWVSLAPVVALARIRDLNAQVRRLQKRLDALGQAGAAAGPEAP